MEARVVVGIDGSEESSRALRWAVEESRLRGGALTVVHAWPAPYSIAAGLEVRSGDRREPDMRTTERRIAEELVEAELGAVEAETSGVRIDRHLVEGPTVPTLLDAASDADLLVVGSRGLGGFKGLILGSVSQQCAQHAPCPVVIVHSGDR